MTFRIFAGKFKGRHLSAPKTDTTRPTQGMLREAVFNICQNEIEGARFLDLFAGSGSMGFEAISRGALQATFVELNKKAVECIKENMTTLDVAGQSVILPYPAQRALQTLLKWEKQFDLIYIDPPYDLKLGDYGDELSKLLAPNGTLFLETLHSAKAKPPELAPLLLKDQRRFGIASLSIFRHM
jgi:16S rRNA (guanine(966)-N(2))-methyltransferase RsmD